MTARAPSPNASAAKDLADDGYKWSETLRLGAKNLAASLDAVDTIAIAASVPAFPWSLARVSWRASNQTRPRSALARHTPPGVKRYLEKFFPKDGLRRNATTTQARESKTRLRVYNREKME
jgi:hypothetical protein